MIRHPANPAFVSSAALQLFTLSSRHIGYSCTRTLSMKYISTAVMVTAVGSYSRNFFSEEKSLAVKRLPLYCQHWHTQKPHHPLIICSADHLLRLRLQRREAGGRSQSGFRQISRVLCQPAAAASVSSAQSPSWLVSVLATICYEIHHLFHYCRGSSCGIPLLAVFWQGGGPNEEPTMTTVNLRHCFRPQGPVSHVKSCCSVQAGSRPESSDK